MSFAAIRQRHITQKGRQATLRRGSSTTANVIAFFSNWAPDEIDGTVLRQGDVRIELLADLGEYPVPPRNPDRIVTDVAAYTILFANPVYEGPTLIGWTLAARGA